MLSSILSLPIQVAQMLDEYALENSTNISSVLRAHYQWTRIQFNDADRSSSLLQAQWMSQRARDMQAKRILDIGCYTGLSALAWYEGTKGTGAEIFTIERNSELAAAARNRFEQYACNERVVVMEGSARSVIADMDKPFDIIFVDLEFSEYRPIVEQILDQELLTPKGIILVDNVFARGFAVDSHNMANIDAALLKHWMQAGELVRNFNSFVASDTRVTVTMLPFFDGISEIRHKNSV